LREKGGRKYGAGTEKMQIDARNCESRTCRPQYESCTANASDAKKPTKAVADPSPAGPKTKVQPKWQPGKVDVPDKVRPATRVPANVQPVGGVQSRPGSGGAILRKGK
jgi:hypothetical protein